MNDRCTPFLKWAGGKRWLVERHLDLVPKNFSNYIEPFLGSGALFFALNPESAILSDINADLILTYQAVRDEPALLNNLLMQHHELHSKDYFYQVRASKPTTKIEIAAWFLYLNRTCWNGLYRVNLRNEFNVPIGTKTDVVLPTDNFESVSNVLYEVDLICRDFEETINLAEAGDFVFVDPPYTVKHNLNGFVKYNDQIFSWGDQLRLRDAVARASARGASVLVTNANHQSIRDLYDGVGLQTPLSRPSILAASREFRVKVEELAIRTWMLSP